MLGIQDPSSQARDDKQLRSVFVGNIPYDSNEDEIKDIFAKIGPVLSFRIVYDRDTGKAKGYGFCEFHDVETAQSAIRNLNGHEFRNRTLRVDSAVNEKGKEELRELKLGEMPIYGQSVPGETAADSINKVMSQIPPDGLLEFLHQMRECIHINPDESRAMLIRNPQLGYALMQALLIMKYIDEKAVDQLILSGLKLDNSQATDELIPKHERAVREIQKEKYTTAGPPTVERPSEFVPKLPTKTGDLPLHYPRASSSEYKRAAKNREGHEYFEGRDREFSQISPPGANQPYDNDRYQFDRPRSRAPPNYDQLHMEYPAVRPYHDQRGSKSRDRDRSQSPKEGKYFEQRESRNYPPHPNIQYDHRMPYNKPIGQFDEFNRDRRDPEYHSGPLPPYQADPPRHRHRGYY